MMKKFAAITSAAQVKNENRLSKRFQGLMTQQQQQQQHTVRHVSHVQDPRENMHVTTSYHQHCSHNYNHQSGTDNIFSVNIIHDSANH